MFGGIHSTLYSEEPFERGGAHAVVKGDGDIIWNQVIRDCGHVCRSGSTTAEELERETVRAERFELMERLSELPQDMTFFTQITMEAAEDTAFLDAMKKARIRGALVGVEAVTPEGLKMVYKDFNLSGDKLVRQLRTFSDHGVHVLGSFIFGLPSDRAHTFAATQELAQKAGLTFAQFVMLTPFPGTVDLRNGKRRRAKIRTK